ncbi:MAG: hypothetical protein J6T57_01050 [Alphaproteobacteria bacterium]|nr:hypothetical protein [Alphaproteobacteria bacterium]
MKKLIVLCSLLCMVSANLGAFGAANVLVPKKADSVAKRDASTTTSNLGASLLPTAIGLVGNVMALSQQQKALAAECEPTGKEVTFVNNMVKEWAIAGAANPMKTSTAIPECDPTRSQSYERSVRESGSNLLVDTSSLCWDTFSAAEARGAVWAGFPKAAVASYCPDGIDGCAESKKKKVTNLWTIFDMINFDESDYTKSEATQAQALLQKAANCSGNKLAAKRLESFGGFVTSTIGGLGQKTNTGSVMDAVSGVISNSGGGLGNLGGLATVASQFLDK